MANRRIGSRRRNLTSRKQLTTFVLRLVVGSAMIALPLAALPASTLTACGGDSCTTSGGGGGSGSGGGGGGSGSGTYSPPPVEPTCADQGGTPIVSSLGTVTIAGQHYAKESVDCSSNLTANKRDSNAHGRLTLVTQSPSSPNPDGNKSCQALTYWVDANTAYEYHRNGSATAPYWGARAGVETWTPDAGATIRPQIITVASFCKVYFVEPYLTSGSPSADGYKWYFNVATNLPVSLPAPTWGSYDLPDLSAKDPGGSEDLYPPYQQTSTVGSNGAILPPQDSPFGPVALINTPYVVDPQIPTSPVTGTTTTTAPVILTIQGSSPRQIGTAHLTMHYTATPIGVQIQDPTNTLASYPQEQGNVLSYANFCSMGALDNSSGLFGSAAADFERGNVPQNYSSYNPSTALCEVDFRLPSVVDTSPHNAWPLAAVGTWNVTYTASYYTTGIPTSYHVGPGDNIILPGNTSGTITPGSALWPNSPDGNRNGAAATTSIRVSGAEAVVAPS